MIGVAPQAELLAVSVGASVAHNEISNSVGAYIANAGAAGQNVSTRSNGAITIHATESATINARGVAAAAALSGGGLAFSLAFAGAFVDNVILSKTHAYVANSVLKAGGAIDLDASDTATINATVGGLAVAAGVGVAAISLAVGVATAENLIGYNADGSVNANEVLAYIEDSKVDADGALTIEAHGHETITAQVVSAAAAISVGAVGIGAAGAGASTQNRVRTVVKAYADGDKPSATTAPLNVHGISAASIRIAADDTATIVADTGSAALSLTAGVAALPVTIAVALAKNEIASVVEAYVNDVATLEAKSVAGTGIDIIAVDAATIRATTVAASIAVGLGGAVGSIAGAGADAFNVIHTRTLAHADYSDLISADDIDVTATDTAIIDSQVRTTAAAASGGVYAGAIAIGAATARNFIGWGTDTTVGADLTTAGTPASVLSNQTVKIASGADAGSVYRNISGAAIVKPALADANWLQRVDFSDRTKWQLVNVVQTPSQTHAYLTHASADAHGTGSVTVAATEAATVTADIKSLAVGVAVGAIAVAASGAGVDIENQVNNSVLAYVDTTRGIGVHAGDSVLIRTTDTSTISATANAVSYAIAVGIGGAVSVSVSDARNTVTNDVEAYATLAKIGTDTGDLTINATESATITTTSTAASVAVGLVVSVASSGATATAAIRTTTKAYADPVELAIGDDVAIDAMATTTATANAYGNAVSVGFIAVSAAVTRATVTLTPTIESRLGGYADARKVLAHGDISVGSTLAASANAKAEGGAIAVGFSVSVGDTTATALIAPAIDSTPMVTTTLSGGHIESTAGAITAFADYNRAAGKVAKGSGATATAYAASGGAIASSGATATATDTPYVDTWVDSDVTLDAKTTIAMTANSTAFAKSTAAGQAGGLVGVGRSSSVATASSTVKSRMEGDVGRAANVDVKALSGDKATASSQGVSGGVFAITDNNSAAATVTPNLDAHIGGAAVINASGTVSVEANTSPEADATTKGVAKGLIGIGGSDGAGVPGRRIAGQRRRRRRQSRRAAPDLGIRADVCHHGGQLERRDGHRRQSQPADRRRHRVPERRHRHRRAADHVYRPEDRRCQRQSGGECARVQRHQGR